MTKFNFYFQKEKFSQGREFKNICAGTVFQGQKEKKSKDYIFLLCQSDLCQITLNSKQVVCDFWTKYSHRRADDGAA